MDLGLSRSQQMAAGALSSHMLRSSESPEKWLCSLLANFRLAFNLSVLSEALNRVKGLVISPSQADLLIQCE